MPLFSRSPTCIFCADTEVIAKKTIDINMENFHMLRPLAYFSLKEAYYLFY